MRVNEPWKTLENNLLPNPKIAHYDVTDEETGTSIRVVGHPPHRLEEPFSLAEIRSFLLHRTFAGFTRQRENPPQIILSVLGKTEHLEFGYPEFRGIEWPEGISLDRDN